MLSHFCFLSQKPALVVINCAPEEAAQDTAREQAEAIQARGLEIFPMAAALRGRAVGAGGRRSARELLREAGLTASAGDRLTAALFRRLGLMTFYTAGEPEAHAWALAGKIQRTGRRGKNPQRYRARDSSGPRSSAYADFEQFGSESKVKAAGRLRLEGKDYQMHDGDVIHIRFKV